MSPMKIARSEDRKADRPQPILRYTRFMAIFDGIAALAFATAVYLVARAWIALPDSIPVHFSARGEPDRWGGKTSILFGPALSFSSILVLSIVSQFPRSFNYLHPITEQNAQRQYTVARELMAMLRAQLASLAVATTHMQIQAARDGFTSNTSTASVLVLAMVAPLLVLVVYFIRAGSAKNG